MIQLTYLFLLCFGFDSNVKELKELESSKSNFVEVVHALLEDAEERKRFFKVGYC